MSRPHRSLVILVAAGLVGAACGSDGTAGPPEEALGRSGETPEEPAERDDEVAAESDGATSPPSTGSGSAPAQDAPDLAEEAYVVDLGDGMTLTVPAGERADVTAAVVEASAEELRIDLSPDGADFTSPVELFVPRRETRPGDEVVVELFRTELISADGSVEGLSATFGDDGWTYEVMHFTDLLDISYAAGEASTAAFFLPFFVADDVEVEETTPVVEVPVGSRLAVDLTDALGIAPAVSQVLDGAGIDPSTSSPFIFLQSDGSLRLVVEGGTRLVECVREGQGTLVLDAAFHGYRLSIRIPVTCVAPRAGFVARDLVLTEFHLTEQLTEEQRAAGARSLAILMWLDSLAFFSHLGLIVDTNGSGELDDGDQQVFMPTPVVDGEATELLLASFGTTFLFGVPNGTDPAAASSVGPVAPVRQDDGTWLLTPAAAPVVVAEWDDTGRAGIFEIDGSDELVATAP